ncbi:MAG TPA: nucleotidyltransferase family protein [Gammaproteobacteria bacterium]
MRVTARPTSPAVTAVVLAAGGSSRLGTPKQLARLRGRALLARAVDAAAAATGRPVIVVVGAAALRLRALVARSFPQSAVEVVYHAGWRSGLAGSLRRGLAALPDDAHAVLCVLSDQPLVDARSLSRLVAAWRRRPGRAAAARYSGRLGVPAIVPRRSFPALRALDGDQGARRVLAADPRVTAVEMPEAAFDVDTVEDLARLAVAARPRTRMPRPRT